MVINITVTNQTIIAIYSTYSILSLFTLTNVLYVPLMSNLIGITKHRQFLMRGLQSSLCKLHSSRTIYHSKTEWVPYQRNLSHLSTSQVPIVNQYFSQQSAWPPNRPCVQRLHPEWKIMTLLCCFVIVCCKN